MGYIWSYFEWWNSGMADYIDKDILCQAYVHIDPVPLDEAELESFQSAI